MSTNKNPAYNPTGGRCCANCAYHHSAGGALHCLVFVPDIAYRIKVTQADLEASPVVAAAGLCPMFQGGAA